MTKERKIMFREMVRKQKHLTQDEIVSLLKTEKRGVLSVIGDEEYPYGVPMNHWYNEKDGNIYFHCGTGVSSHRNESLAKHDKVSFCVVGPAEHQNDWVYKVKSVIVFGRMEMIEDKDTIIDIVTELAHKFTDDNEYIKKEMDSSLHRTLLLKLNVEHICGKWVEES